MVKRSSKRRTQKRGRKMRGGFIRMNPADVADTSMDSSRQLSLAQGGEYAKIHSAQHGGFAPVGDTGVLDGNLRSSAHLGPLDESFHAIAGMRDQGGGRRKKSKSKSKSKRKTKKSRSTRRRRTHKGGSMGAPYSQNGSDLLLPSSESVPTMNETEWTLAENPNSFVPDAVVKGNQ